MSTRTIREDINVLPADLRVGDRFTDGGTVRKRPVPWEDGAILIALSRRGGTVKGGSGLHLRIVPANASVQVSRPRRVKADA